MRTPCKKAADEIMHVFAAYNIHMSSMDRQRIADALEALLEETFENFVETRLERAVTQVLRDLLE